MLSYQHAYHAGGPADIHKHVGLVALLGHLAAKEKPFVVIDLFAGNGVYDLEGEEAVKTGEFTTGAGALWMRREEAAPSPVVQLLTDIKALNPDGRLRHYPGSPALARTVLRADDALILNELHPAAYRDLRRWATRNPRISVHKRDGLEALPALIPPKIKRGLVVIDPSYEIKSEYRDVAQTLAKAVRKWPQGIYLMWYPVLPEARHLALIEGLQTDIDADIHRCELTLNARKGKPQTGLQGTGFAVINPPWQFDRLMEEAGDWLVAKIFPEGRHSCAWLKRSESPLNSPAV